MFDSTPILQEQLNNLDAASLSVVEAVINMYLNGHKAEADAFYAALLEVVP